MRNRVFGACARNGKTGRVRRLFAEAYTPDGKLSFLDTLEVETARQISTPQGVPTSACTEAVLALVVARGWEAVALCDPLEPACISHVYVPELKLLLCSEPCGAAVPLGIEAFIKLSDASAQLALTKNETLTEQLISMAVEALNSARAIHQKTEQIYIEHMDFHKADAIADELFYNLKDWLTA